MLDGGQPTRLIAGVAVGCDHADRARFYAFGPAPRLVHDPEPRLKLVMYRGERSGGGGLLQLETFVGLRESEERAVRDQLARDGVDQPTIVRPDWVDGAVQLSGWFEAGGLAPVQLFVGQPSLLPDARVIVLARLPQAGAALARAALHGDALPLCVVYRLDTIALMGPLGVEVEADLGAIHRRLTAEGALTTPYGRARLAKTWEDFAKENLIRVRVIDETGETETTRAEAVRRVGQDLVARMFSPQPPAETAPLLDDGAVAPVELSFRLTAREESLETHSSWSFRERRAHRVSHYCAASLIGLLDGNPAAAHIEELDLDQPPRTTTLRVRTEPELAEAALAALEVDLRWTPAAEAPERSVLLDAARPQVELLVEHPPIEPVWYRARARFDPLLTTAQSVTTGWLEATGELIHLSPRRLFPPRTVLVAAGRVDFSWIEVVEVLVTVEGQPARTARLTAATPTARLYFAAARELSMQAAVRWHGRAGEPSHAEAARAVVDDVLLVDAPFGPSIDVMVALLTDASLASTVVEARVPDDELHHSVVQVWDAPDRGLRHLLLRRMASTPAEYEYRVTRTFADARVVDEGWRRTARTALSIPEDSGLLVQTEVFVLGGPAGRGALAIELTLSAGLDEHREVLTGTQDSARLAVATNAPDTAVLKVRELLADGTERLRTQSRPPAMVVLAPETI